MSDRLIDCEACGARVAQVRSIRGQRFTARLERRGPVARAERKGFRRAFVCEGCYGRIPAAPGRVRCQVGGCGACVELAGLAVIEGVTIAGREFFMAWVVACLRCRGRLAFTDRSRRIAGAVSGIDVLGGPDLWPRQRSWPRSWLRCRGWEWGVTAANVGSKLAVLRREHKASERYTVASPYDKVGALGRDWQPIAAGGAW